MKNRKMQTKTTKKLFLLYIIALAKGRSLTAQEIAETIDCSKSHAYNYKRDLDRLISSKYP